MGASETLLTEHELSLTRGQAIVACVSIVIESEIDTLDPALSLLTESANRCGMLISVAVIGRDLNGTCNGVRPVSNRPSMCPLPST